MKRLSLLLLGLLPLSALAQDKAGVEKTDKNFAASPDKDFWIYNDLPSAFKRAKVNGKPIMVVYRCIP